MLWYRLWKKVHRPLIVLSVVAFIVVTASHSEIKFHNAEHQSDEHRSHNKNNHRLATPLSSFSDNDLLLRSTISDKNSQETFLATPSNNDDDDLLGSIPKIPIPPPVQQLPYCNNNKWNTGNNGGQVTKTKAGGGGGDEAGSSSQQYPYQEQNYNNSDGGEIVPIGRHVVVATLDGKLSLLDQSGQILWTICTGQIFSSTISSLQLNENGKFIHLIPSLTGGLYKYDGDNLTPMPLNAESLLRRSFKLSNDVVMTGGKELRTFGIALSSGNLRYECGLDGCSTPTKAESHSEDDVVLVVKKQLQTVRAIDSSTGSERWNFSVATHELALAGVTEGCYEGEKKETSQDHLVKVIIPEGIIMGADKSNHAVWQHKFGSPISQAWILEDGKLKVIDPIKNSPLLDESPALYIGIHKQQFYVQESHSTAEKLEMAFAIPFSNNQAQSKPIEITWKPSSVIEGMNENRALAKYEPEFPGFYIFEKEETTKNLPAIEAPPGTSSESNKSGQNQFPDDEPSYFTEGVIQIIFVSLWYWWKEVTGIALLTAVILHVLLFRPWTRYVEAQTVRKMLASIRNLRNIQQEQRALVPRRESDTLELPPPAYRIRTRTTSSSSNISQTGHIEEPPPMVFNSQYLREFVPISCLGKGGFGVVFEAKKKIDDRHYAVKRISLPNREKHREKVMREVKALAKLDHKNIVRYFNAWTENPPPGWLEQNDPLWSMCNFESSSANYLSSFDNTSPWSTSGIVVHQQQPISTTGPFKREYSEISMPNKTPVDERTMDDDDSFIVFAAEGHSIDDDDDDDANLQKNSTIVKKQDSFLFARGGKKSKKMSKLKWNNDCEESDYKLSSSPLLPVTINDSLIGLSRNGPSENSAASASGFFIRPTSLEIPSSSSMNDDNDQDDENYQQLQVLEEAEEIGEDALSSIPPIMYLYIQQELCQKKTLQVWLRTTKSRKLRHVVEFFSQIVEAVEYIHSHKLIHRDLKPANIFMSSNGSNIENSASDSSDCEFVTVKIGDFGLATTAVSRLDKENNTFTPATENGPRDHTVGNLTGHVGTQLYMSPEQSQNKPYDFKVDIYSLGLIFFELLVPFSTEMERHEVLTKVRRMEFPPSFSQEYTDEHALISDMVAHDADKRPTASEIKSWVKTHLRNLSPADDCTPIASNKFDSHCKSKSADIFPVKKYVNRLSYDDEKLSRTQSCI